MKTQQPTFVGSVWTPSTFSGRGVKPLDTTCANGLRGPAVGRMRRVRQAPITMGLFGLGFPELAVIAGIGILIFGPSKIADMGKDLGGIAGGVKKATAEFKDAMEQSLEEADREIELRKQEKEGAKLQGTSTTPNTATDAASITSEQATTEPKDVQS